MWDDDYQSRSAAALTSSLASESNERQGSYPEPVDTLGSPPEAPERTRYANAEISCSNATPPSAGAAPEKSRFYIEVDSSAVVNLKAGTQYTLVPLESYQATEPAAPTSGCIAHSLDLVCSLDRRPPGDESAGNPGAGSQDDLTSEPFGLGQYMMSPFGEPDEAIDPDTPLDRVFGAAEYMMSDIPLVDLSHEYLEHQQQAQAHDVAAPAHMQHATSGYDAAALPYRHPASPVCVAPPQPTLQHQASTPLLGPQRGNWTPYIGPMTPQAYHPLTAAGHSGTAACAANVIPGGAVSSSSGAATAATSGLHATLGADGVTSAGGYRSATGSGIVGGVTSMTNTRRMEIRQNNRVPVYMPFNGRDNHIEKERWRRSRIRNACQALRSIVPGLSETTDAATVVEFTVQYLMHLRNHISSRHERVGIRN